MNELALFAGAGGGILGGKLLGWRTVCAVEWEAYPASVLCARQNDGLLESFPIWDDIQTFDGKPWRGIVDVISGGFPCQDISTAGKGAGIDGERSGMWGEMARVIREVQPRFVFVENSPMLVSRGLGRVLGDLASMGFDAKWGVLGAADIGANHKRDRIWIVGKAQSSNANLQSPYAKQECKHDWSKESSRSGTREMGASDAQTEISNSDSKWELQPQRCQQEKRGWIGDKSWWQFEPDVGRMAYGISASVDRLKAIGNGQVPLCAATAWRVLTK
jgi:DNA (cytosine-5)-methyltransferase 1